MKRILQKNTAEAELEASQAAAVYWKRLKYMGVVVIGSGVLAVVSYYSIWPRFRNWRQEKSLAEAEHHEGQRDYRRALLILEQTVQLYPGNLEARRRLAGFLERLGQRQALQLWKELAEAGPGDSKNLLGLAGAALRFGEVDLTRQTLAKLREAGHEGVEYHRLASGLALMTRDNAALENALVELAKLQPENLRVQLNLAVVRLSSPDTSKAEAGRAALVVLAQFDAVRIRAVVELLNEMARRWPRPSPARVEAFRQLAKTLTPSQGPRLDPPELADPVERLVSFAMRQPQPAAEDAGMLMAWLILNGRAAAAFAWLDTLPAPTRQSTLVTAAASEAALRVKDWPRLQQLLVAGAWGVVPPAVVNEAFALRESRQQGDSTRDAGQWVNALEGAEGSLPALQMLLRLSEAWQWKEEQQQVLTAITRDFATETWAWRQLISSALEEGDAEQVWEIYQRWSRAAPGDVTVQVEMAIMGHLLQERGVPGTDVTGELVRLHPGNPGAAVAHALALWRNRQVDAAVALLAALPPSAFDEPRYALAHGLILAQAGRARESEEMLNRASADRKLPAELLLIEHARARNQPRLAPSRGF